MSPDSPLVGTVTPSPNFGDRAGRQVDALILHYTGMKTGELARARLLDPAFQVSCHYLVWEDGAVEQLVAETSRAWHAGRSFWAGETDMNSVSIGIEIVNGGHESGCPPFPATQIDGLVRLVCDICERHRIRPERVLGHSDIAPQRKRDPGEWFPWRRLVQAGVAEGLTPTGNRKRHARESDAAPLDVHALQEALSGIGFHCPSSGVVDETTRDVIKAFQRRYRPARIDGIVDGETRYLIEACRSLRL